MHISKKVADNEKREATILKSWRKCVSSYD